MYEVTGASVLHSRPVTPAFSLLARPAKYYLKYQLKFLLAGFQRQLISGAILKFRCTNVLIKKYAQQQWQTTENMQHLYKMSRFDCLPRSKLQTLNR